MFCVSASFISLLQAVVQNISFVSLAYVREICEDGSLSVGIEVHIPLNFSAGCSFSRIFWGCSTSGCVPPLDCAALQAVIYLQSIYGFTVFYYSYGGVVWSRLSISSAVDTARNAIDICRCYLNQEV